MECDHIEKLKWKDDKLLRESGQREINIQDKMWRLFTNIPMISRKNTQYGRKILTKLIISIEEVIYTTPPPRAATLGKIGTLKNREHKKVDWDALS